MFLTHSCSVILLSASQTVDELRASLTLACLSLNLPGNRCYRRRTATAATQQFAAREADRWKEGGNGDRGEQGRKPKGLSATVEKSPGMRNGRAGNLSLHEDTGRGRDRGRSVGRSVGGVCCLRLRSEVGRIDTSRVRKNGRRHRSRQRRRRWCDSGSVRGSMDVWRTMKDRSLVGAAVVSGQ